jgi:putative ABC transport system permease protein
MFGEKIRNNIAVAIDTLRANKLRSALTILGVVMGVSTVMAMAAIVQGIKEQIVRTIEIAGPTTFYVIKAFSQTPVNPDRLPVWIRIRPDLSPEEGKRIQSLPEISYAAIWGKDVSSTRECALRICSSWAQMTGSPRFKAASS